MTIHFPTFDAISFTSLSVLYYVNLFVSHSFKNKFLKMVRTHLLDSDLHNNIKLWKCVIDMNANHSEC